MPIKQQVRKPYKMDIPQMPADFKGFDYSGDNGGTLTAGPEQNAVQRFLSSLKPDSTADRIAQTGRGLFNSVVPGVALDQLFKFDAYNPVTGTGRRDYVPEEGGEMDQNARIGGAAGMMAQNILGGDLVKTVGTANKVRQAAPAVGEAVRDASLLFKNKVWDSLPQALRESPEFIRDATARFNKVNEGRAVTRNLTEAPTLVGEALGPNKPSSFVSRFVDTLKGAGNATVRSMAENPYKYKAAAGAAASLGNEAMNSIDAQDAAKQGGPGEEIIDLPATEVDMGGDQPMAAPQPKKLSASERYKQTMAGNKPLEDYKPTMLERGLSYLFPSSEGLAIDQRKRNFMEDQMMKNAYADPEHAFALKELMADLQSERGLADVEATNNLPSNRRKETQGFAERYAPAFQPEELANLFGVDASKIDKDVLARMARGAPSMTDIMMLQLMQNMPGAGGGMGGQQQQTPQLDLGTNRK